MKFFTRDNINTALIVGTILATMLVGYWSIKVGRYYGEKGLALQNEAVNLNSFPSFKYPWDRDKKLFRIEGNGIIEPTKVSWIFPEYIDGKIKNTVIFNGHPLYLSLYEIQDFLAKELSFHYFQLKDKKVSFDDVKFAVDCGIFVYAQDGIPIVIDIEYGMADKTGLKTSKTALIQRLDTNEPIVKIVSNSFQGDIDKSLVDFFDGKNGERMKDAYEIAAEQALKPQRSGTKTKCGFLMNQPIEGY